MSRIFAYMRISTKEERGKQKFTRQENAIQKWCEENKVKITDKRIYKDDASGKNFDRTEWKELEEEVKAGDTIVFKDICRFTRECENGLEKYMELMNRGINLVFLDNMTLSTDYIKALSNAKEKQGNVVSLTMDFVVKLILTVELDRAEQEREITVKRITDGIHARPKKANGKIDTGRKDGSLCKMTPELENDIEKYIVDRSIKQVDLMRKHKISRNTLKKYIALKKEKEVK